MRTLLALDELTDRLADFQAALDTGEPGDVSSEAGEHATVGELAQVTHAESAAELTGTCAQLKAPVSEYLRHDQFQLALRALATTLRRDSQDMRAYALKREALHSKLITDEESRAYLAASIYWPVGPNSSSLGAGSPGSLAELAEGLATNCGHKTPTVPAHGSVCTAGGGR